MASSAAFAKKIHLLSILKGKTQAELARGINMLPNNLNRYLRGHRDVHAGHFAALLKELGIDLDDILNREIAALNEMKLQENPKLGDAMESVVRSMKPSERKTLLKYMATMAHVNLGARSKRNIETIRAWAK